MPQWAGSCWYYLRFVDPRNDEALASPEALQYWGTPDLYVGGAEHAVLHLLYARFWHKVLIALVVTAMVAFVLTFFCIGFLIFLLLAPIVVEGAGSQGSMCFHGDPN